jgi:hypothetical protein
MELGRKTNCMYIVQTSHNIKNMQVIHRWVRFHQYKNLLQSLLFYKLNVCHVPTSLSAASVVIKQSIFWIKNLTTLNNVQLFGHLAILQKNYSVSRFWTEATDSACTDMANIRWRKQHLLAVLIVIYLMHHPIVHVYECVSWANNCMINIAAMHEAYTHTARTAPIGLEIHIYLSFPSIELQV